MFGGGGSGTIYQNEIRGFNWGVGSIWGSVVDFTDFTRVTDKNNLITECYYGIYAYQQGYAYITPSAEGFGEYFKWNSIHSNTYKNVYFTSGGTIYARKTYWGGTPSSSMWYLGSGCSIDYSYWLTSDPWIEPIASPIVLNMNTQLSKPQEIVPPTKEESLFQGIEMRLKKKYKQAKDFFVSYLSKHPDDQAAYVQLYNSYNDETANDITNFFTSLPAGAAKEHKLLLSYLYLKQGNVALAKKYNEKLAGEYPNTELAVRAKINNFYISLYNENDPVNASAILDDILTQKVLTTPIELSLAQHALSTYVEGEGGNGPSKPLLKELDLNVPDFFDLSQNFPNPFNPVTTMAYRVTRPGKVSLKVFDLLGREVATLVNGEQGEGVYTQRFDASHLASGIYFYRLLAPGVNETRKMLIAK